MHKCEHQGIIDQMSLEEKISLCSGADFWSTVPFEKFNIPSVIMTDGPHGIRKITDGGMYPGASQTAPATCFPLACLTACSWDRDLLHEMGEALAEEAMQEGISIILGPGSTSSEIRCAAGTSSIFRRIPTLPGRWLNTGSKVCKAKGLGSP